MYIFNSFYSLDSYKFPITSIPKEDYNRHAWATKLSFRRAFPPLSYASPGLGNLSNDDEPTTTPNQK